MPLYERKTNKSHGLRWSEVYGKTTCWTLELSRSLSCHPEEHRLCSNMCVWQQFEVWCWALQNHIDLGNATQFLGFAKKGVCNWEKRMQLFTSFFLRAKNRMFSICGRGRSYVLPEEFLLTGWAGSGDKLPWLAWHQSGPCPEAGKMFSLSPSFPGSLSQCSRVPFHRLNGAKLKVIRL